MLLAFAVSAAGYAVLAHVYAWFLRLQPRLVLGGHAATTGTALVTSLVFLVASDDSLMQQWVCTYVCCWPLLLLAVGLAGCVHVMASVFVACDARSRRWLPITLAGAPLHAYGLFVLLSYAPTA